MEPEMPENIDYHLYLCSTITSKYKGSCKYTITYTASCCLTEINHSFSLFKQILLENIHFFCELLNSQK